MTSTTGHGGKREGAGRPKGSRMRRSDALAEKIVAAGLCPVDALIRLAERAENEGDLGQAIGAWKSILPYIYPRPKSVEFAADEVVELARDLAMARVEVLRTDTNFDHVALLERFLKDDIAAP
ncbi:hypothetical protein [Sedimentimonas flavescens]|uniref:hypothetical protein n=1 Tax=Sedimentimonas flavescens TaxID=2851012 RepID=UPI0021A97034|nr:hypothetical protein [Sedimentimonas flavescens]MCT2538759.1 hypothetical protein [Sedimentimonas flavescens]